jgi:hypothetical protein
MLYYTPKGDVYCCSTVIDQYNKQVQKNRLKERLMLQITQIEPHLLLIFFFAIFYLTLYSKILSCILSSLKYDESSDHILSILYKL